MRTALVSMVVATVAQAQTVISADGGVALQVRSGYQGNGGATQDLSLPYEWIGGREWTMAGDLYMLGFGYNEGDNTPAVVVGEQVENTGQYEYGGLIVATKKNGGRLDKLTPRLFIDHNGFVRVGSGEDGGVAQLDGTGALLEVNGDISTEGYSVAGVNDAHPVNGRIRPQRWYYTPPIQFSDAGEASYTFPEPYGIGGGYCVFQYYYVGPSDQSGLLTIVYANSDDLQNGGSTGMAIYGSRNKYFFAICIGGYDE